jgi:pimeloyl-ACP methyl ester carboxylesterase
MIAVGTAVRHQDLVRSLAALSSGYSEAGNLPELRKMQRDPEHVPSAELQPPLPTAAEYAAWQAHYKRHAPRPEAMGEGMTQLQAMIVAWPG